MYDYSKVLESRTEYAGKIVSIRRDKLTRGDGNTFIRETAVASDAVGIVAMDDRGRILLIRQYRHPMGRPVWEIPAGRMDVEGEKRRRLLCGSSERRQTQKRPQFSF